METPPDILSLRCLAGVVETGSISTAARALGMSQPAVTQRLARLETIAQTPLLDRSRRPLRPTQAGRDLVDGSQAFLREATSLQDLIPRLGQSRTELLRIGMPDSLAEVLGAELLGALGSSATRVELRSGISPWLEHSFRDGAFDLAIDSPPYLSAPRSIHLSLFDDPMVLVKPAGAGPDLGASPHVAYGRNSKLGQLCAGAAADLGATGPSRFSFDSTQSLLRFVQAGYGWTVTTAFCLLQSPETAAGLQVQPIKGAQARRFELLAHDRVADGAGDLAARFRAIMLELAAGPWSRRLGEVAGMIERANGVESQSRK